MTADPTPPVSHPGEALSIEAQDAAPLARKGGSYAQDSQGGASPARRTAARTDQHTPNTDDAPQLAEAIEGEVDPGEAAIAPSFHIEPKSP